MATIDKGRAIARRIPRRPEDDGVLVKNSHFRIRSNGLTVDGNPTFEQWRDFGSVIRTLGNAAAWAIGDWLLYGEGRGDWGEMYSQAMDETGRSYGGLRTAVWVAKKFDLSRRRDNLTLQHHVEVASFDEPTQEAWLDRAVEKAWTAKELHEEIRSEKHAARTVNRDWPAGKFSVILADPPWRYEWAKSEEREIENHYPTMTTEQIFSLDEKVEAKAAKDCVLFLWATAPKLPDAMEVMARWGFTYKTNAVWVKDLLGMGYWFRGRHELLLVGVRGTPAPPVEADRLYSVIEAPRRGHSEKPDELYAMLERMFPEQPKLELFARPNETRPEQWSTWGNEDIVDAQEAV